MHSFGQLPVLQLPGGGDGLDRASQSLALLRWAGRKAAIYPKDIDAQLRCDVIEQALADLNAALLPLWYKAACRRSPIDGVPMVPLSEEQLAEAQRCVADVLLPVRLRQLEATLAKSGGDFFCGESLTTCDLIWYIFATEVLDGTTASIGIPPTALESFPALAALRKRVAEQPKVAEWNESHGSVPAYKPAKPAAEPTALAAMRALAEDESLSKETRAGAQHAVDEMLRAAEQPEEGVPARSSGPGSPVRPPVGRRWDDDTATSTSPLGHSPTTSPRDLAALGARFESITKTSSAVAALPADASRFDAIAKAAQTIADEAGEIAAAVPPSPISTASPTFFANLVEGLSPSRSRPIFRRESDDC